MKRKKQIRNKTSEKQINKTKQKYALLFRKDKTQQNKGKSTAAQMYPSNIEDSR